MLTDSQLETLEELLARPVPYGPLPLYGWQQDAKLFMRTLTQPRKPSNDAPVQTNQ